MAVNDAGGAMGGIAWGGRRNGEPSPAERRRFYTRITDFLAFFTELGELPGKWLFSLHKKY